MSVRCLSMLIVSLVPIVAGADAPPPERLDAHGFPLPVGALTRLGDLHFAQPGYIRALALSPDDKIIATAGLRSVYLWNPTTGLIERELAWASRQDKDAKDYLGRLAFSRDGRFLAGGTGAGDVMIWEVATGKPHWPMRDRAASPKKTMGELRFINKDSLLAVAYEESRVQLWDVSKGTLTKVWEIDDEKRDQLKATDKNLEFVGAALSPSGELMAWLASPKSDEDPRAVVFIHETSTGRLRHEVKYAEFANHVHLLDEGRTLLLRKSPVRELLGQKNAYQSVIVDILEGRERFRLLTRWRVFRHPGLGEGPEPPTILGIAPNGKSLITKDFHGIIHWNLENGTKLLESNNTYDNLAFCSDGKRIITSIGPRLEIYDEHLKPRKPRRVSGSIPFLNFHPDGRLLVVLSKDGGETWEPKSGRKLTSPTFARFPAVEGYGAYDFGYWKNLVVHAQNKKFLVRDLSDRTIKCELKDVRLPNDWENNPRFSEDGKRILVTTDENEEILVRWFESEGGTELGRIRIPKKNFYAGQNIPSWHSTKWYSFDGSLFGYITSESRLALVDCEQRRVRLEVGMATPASAVGPVSSAVPEFQFPDWEYQRAGKFIVGCRASQEFALWDVSTGRLLRQFCLHVEGQKFGASFRAHWNMSPNARLVVVSRGGQDELNLVETLTGRVRGRLPNPSNLDSFVPLFAPDGKTLATTCSDNSVLIWDMDRPLSGRPALPVPKGTAESDTFWKQLGAEDAPIGEQAIWALVRAPEWALPFLKQRLHPVVGPAPEKLQALITQLDHAKFQERDLATQELTKLGDLATVAIRAAISGPSRPLEQLRRLQRILSTIEDPRASPCYLAELRALEALERIGSDDACRLLEKISVGAADSILTREAHLALERLRGKNDG